MYKALVHSILLYLNVLNQIIIFIDMISELYVGHFTWRMNTNRYYRQNYLQLNRL